MAREAIKLSVEKHGKGFRYKRSFKGQLWKSQSYPNDTREAKREAWAAFVEWREAQVDQPAPPPADDSYGLIRQLLASKSKTLLDHAQLTANPQEAKVWQDILATLPKMDGENLFSLTALLAGEYAGQDHTPVIRDREQTVKRIKNNSNPNLTASKLANEYVERLRRKADANRGSYGHYGQIKVALDHFCKVYGPSRSMEHFNEKSVRDFSEYLEGLIDAEAIEPATAHSYQQRFRTWADDLAENYPDDIPRPKNLRSKKLLIANSRKEPNPFTLEEAKLVISAAVPRTKLFLMLMLNCGMYQSDIAALNAIEVDWEAGRIIRARTKNKNMANTLGKSQPVKANWLLWPQTWQLFKQFAKPEGLCFLSATGGALLTHKPTTRNDAIRSAYRRTIDKLKRRKLLPKEWNKTLKQFRKTGANLIQKSQEHGKAYALYLNHSIAKEHYLTSGEPVPSFDQAIIWLGTQIFESN